jgi:CDGSH-type Zn-finger protein
MSTPMTSATASRSRKELDSRCGASNTEPFCNGSHTQTGFRSQERDRRTAGALLASSHALCFV